MLVAAMALTLSTGAAAAQPTSKPGMEHGQMSGHMPGHASMGASHMKPAMNDFMASMNKMDKAMTAAQGGSVDETFARKMISHHQGAIDMAEIELKHGSDA